MPTYGLALLFFTSNYISTFTPLALRLTVTVITFVFTFILPSLNALILLKTGRINSFEMETRKERVIPYISTALYFFALFYLFHQAQFPSFLNMLILAAAIAIIAAFLVNYKWKISAHAVGIGGLIGAIMGISLRLSIDLHLIIILLILCAGFAGYARLKLDAHSPAQVYTGFLLGFLAEFLLMIFH